MQIRFPTIPITIYTHKYIITPLRLLCHLDTHDEWEASQHSKDLTCNQCYNPHTTDIRAVAAHPGIM